MHYRNLIDWLLIFLTVGRGIAHDKSQLQEFA